MYIQVCVSGMWLAHRQGCVWYLYTAPVSDGFKYEEEVRTTVKPPKEKEEKKGKREGGQAGWVGGHDKADLSGH